MKYTIVPVAIAIVFTGGVSLIAGRNAQADASAIFQPMPMPPGIATSSVAAISADGLVIVGTARSGSPANTFTAFRWTPAAGAAGFELLDSPDAYSSSAEDISADGSVIVGSSRKNGGYITPVMWSTAHGFERLRESDGQHHVVATRVTADGSLVSGTSSTIAEDGPVSTFTWSRDQGYGEIVTPYPYAEPADFSATGNVLVGQAGSTFAGRAAFRWTPEDGTQMLATFTQPLQNTVAMATNSDGSIIVGTYLKPLGGSGVFRWTQQTGITAFDELGFAPSAMSGDGSVIVGRSKIWDAAHGARELSDVLASRGVNIGTWKLYSAIDVSADGQRIAGYGFNPTGNLQAWYIDLSVPEPATAILALCALLCATAVRTKRGSGRR